MNLKTNKHLSSRILHLFLVSCFIILSYSGLYAQGTTDTTGSSKMTLEEKIRQIIKNTDQKTNSDMGPNSVRIRVSVDPETEELVLEEIAKGKVFPGVGDMFADFTVQQDPHDPSSKVSLSDYVGKGKFVVLDFWASWCAPCIKELEAVRHAYHNLPKDKVVFISIAINDRLEKTRQAALKHNIEWEQIVNAGNVPMLAYGFTSIPQIVLFAPDGKILRKDLGGEELLTETARYVRLYRMQNPDESEDGSYVKTLTY